MVFEMNMNILLSVRVFKVYKKSDQYFNFYLIGTEAIHGLIGLAGDTKV